MRAPWRDPRRRLAFRFAKSSLRLARSEWRRPGNAAASLIAASRSSLVGLGGPFFPITPIERFAVKRARSRLAARVRRGSV